MPKYSEMSAPEMLKAVGDDAQKWADAFHEQFPSVPHDVMVGWFANAIEHSSDVRRWRVIHDDAAWAEHIDSIVHERRFWRELHSQHGPVVEAA